MWPELEASPAREEGSSLERLTNYMPNSGLDLFTVGACVWVCDPEVRGQLAGACFSFHLHPNILLSLVSHLNLNPFPAEKGQESIPMMFLLAPWA